MTGFRNNRSPLQLDEELTYLLSQATLATGRLSGLASIIPDPDLFVYLYVRKAVNFRIGVV